MKFVQRTQNPMKLFECMSFFSAISSTCAKKLHLNSCELEKKSKFIAKNATIIHGRPWHSHANLVAHFIVGIIIHFVISITENYFYSFCCIWHVKIF